MNFEKIKFKQASSQKIYNEYFKQINAHINSLPKEEQLDILMEMNSYIFEGMQNSNEENELEYLYHIIDNFGDLETTLNPIVEERKLTQATKAFNPVHIFNTIGLTILNGFFFILVTICFMGLGFGGIATLAKIFSPNQIGMYYKPNEYFVLAGIPEAGINEIEYELLGVWYIPTMLLGMLLLGVLITFIFRLEEILNNEESFDFAYKSKYIPLN